VDGRDKPGHDGLGGEGSDRHALRKAGSDEEERG